jgi:hypothetical protein
VKRVTAGQEWDSDEVIDRQFYNSKTDRLEVWMSHQDSEVCNPVYPDEHPNAYYVERRWFVWDIDSGGKCESYCAESLAADDYNRRVDSRTAEGRG